MCWAIVNSASSGLLPDDRIVQSYDNEAVRSGKGTVAIRKVRGELVATEMRYGTIVPNPMGRRGLFWNARADKVSKVAIWTRLHRQRCVVPISAYCENRPAETWLSGAPAYMIGFYDTHVSDGGLVTITENDGTEDGRRPIVTDEAGARAWIDAQTWDIDKTIASVTRVVYDELDLFAGKTLSVEVRRQIRSQPRRAA